MKRTIITEDGILKVKLKSGQATNDPRVVELLPISERLELFNNFLEGLLTKK